jgi:hypothetical protein
MIHVVFLSKLKITYNFSYFTLREIIERMVQAYSQRIFNGQKPVFDGRKNLYSRDPLPNIGRDKVHFIF